MDDMDDMRPKSLMLLLVFLVFLLFPLPPTLSWADGKDEQGEKAEKDVISASRARELVDQFVTVEGKVVATQQEGRNTFLTLSSSATPELTVAITPPLLLSGFPDRPDTFYQGKTVQVKGRVYLFRGRPEMLISAADRITVIGPLAGPLASEPPALREALRVRPRSDSSRSERPRPERSPETPTTSALPRALLTGPETTVLDLRRMTRESQDQGFVSDGSEVCTEAQTLWRQVTQELVPHLRHYTTCLEKGSLGCDPAGEKVALGMLGVQQAQKRVRVSCQ